MVSLSDLGVDLDVLGAFFSVVVIDVVLAGDNAIVVGMAAAGFEPRRRRQIIIGGVVAATVLRIALASVALQLLAIIGLTLAGGILLLWVAWKFYRDLAAPTAHATARRVPPPPPRRAATPRVDGSETPASAASPTRTPAAETTASWQSARGHGHSSLRMHSATCCSTMTSCGSISVKEITAGRVRFIAGFAPPGSNSQNQIMAVTRPKPELIPLQVGSEVRINFRGEITLDNPTLETNEQAADAVIADAVEREPTAAVARLYVDRGAARGDWGFLDRLSSLVKRGDGVVVYSVGQDGKDHGGKLRHDPGEEAFGPDGLDIGFQLWDVNARRQPPGPVLLIPDDKDR